MHSPVIHFCIYFPYFLPYFILLPKVTYMETEIFWVFLFKFLCSFYVSFFAELKLFGYPSWIASETRAFFTDNCPTKNRMAWLWQGHLERGNCTLGNSNINPRISLAFPACVWSLRAHRALEIQENLYNQFQQVWLYQVVAAGLGVPCFHSLLLQLERGQSNTQWGAGRGGKERRGEREREAGCVYACIWFCSPQS